MTHGAPRPLIDLTGKQALVTGGSRGVGRATALMLAQAGASVGIGYRSRKDEADRTVVDVAAFGVASWAEPGDLSDAAEVARLFARVDDEFAGLDLFVGNAGVWPVGDVALADMKDEQWRSTMGANLDSIFYTCRAAARTMRDGGAIVLVSSTAGQRGEAYHGDYAASKGAMLSLVKGLCVELAPRDVTVNAVAPGWIDTEMSRPALGGGSLERINQTIPRGRVASPEDIAGPIAFLCSSMARHITGEILNVNGGAVLVG
ncbi:MAG: 3-oxoacyl-[acyl-carrier-protein] reductase [Gemmatimonadota bacterium]|nr:MAG: 3-oxoacyl-[acyl-carrier-protein] reductase [Gemmatimonadota bacterium]